MSAQGIIFWGVWWENDELPEEQGDPLNERAWMMEKAAQDEALPRPPLDESPSGRSSPEWDEWRKAIHAWESRQCYLGHAGHCDNSYATYAYVRASRKRAEWSDMVALTSLEAPPEWRDKLLAYCLALGLPWKEPGWWLTSSYG